MNSQAASAEVNKSIRLIWVDKSPKDLISIPLQQIPEPPEGRAWANAANLTAEQIGISEGFRLLLVGEIIPDDYQLRFPGRWGSGCGMEGLKQKNDSNTRRTKKPLPQKKRVPLEWSDVPPGSSIAHPSIPERKWAMVSVVYESCVSVEDEILTFQELMDGEIARPPEYKWEKAYKEVEE